MRDALAVEEPLEIRIAWTSESGTRVVEPLAVTMRTPGDDFELVAGFLHGEGVVSGAADLAELTYCRGDEAQGQATNHEGDDAGHHACGYHRVHAHATVGATLR